MHLRNPNAQHNRNIDHLVEELHDSGHVNDLVQEMDDPRELQLRNSPQLSALSRPGHCRCTTGTTTSPRTALRNHNGLLHSLHEGNTCHRGVTAMYQTVFSRVCTPSARQRKSASNTKPSTLKAAGRTQLPSDRGRNGQNNVPPKEEEVEEVHRCECRTNISASLLPSYARLNANTRDDEVRKCNTKRRDHDRNAACRLRTTCARTPAGRLECATTPAGVLDCATTPLGAI